MAGILHSTFGSDRGLILRGMVVALQPSVTLTARKSGKEFSRASMQVTDGDNTYTFTQLGDPGENELPAVLFDMVKIRVTKAGSYEGGETEIQGECEVIEQG